MYNIIYYIEYYEQSTFRNNVKRFNSLFQNNNQNDVSKNE